jgi:hypothetical protein
MGVRCNGQKRKTPSHALPPLAHPEPEREKTPQPTNQQTNKQTQESARNASAALPNAKLIISAS